MLCGALEEKVYACYSSCPTKHRCAVHAELVTLNLFKFFMRVDESFLSFFPRLRAVSLLL